jgi:hypothetical protein
MFARFLLGDLFVHGIGGAKYDELGDEIAARFFGFEPPPYLALSMTLWLAIGENPAERAQLVAADRAIRDLTYNPERFLDAPSSEERRLIKTKQAAIMGPVATHAERVARFREIRRCNALIASNVSESRLALEADRTRVLEGLRHNGLARSREYSVLLHSQCRLRSAMASAVAGSPIVKT